MVQDRTFDDQRLRAGGLNLVVAAIVLWNTVYLERAVETLRASGMVVPDELLKHLSPLAWRTHRPDRRVSLGIRTDAPTRSAAGATTSTLTCLTGASHRLPYKIPEMIS